MGVRNDAWLREALDRLADNAIIKWRCGSVAIIEFPRSALRSALDLYHDPDDKGWAEILDEEGRKYLYERASRDARLPSWEAGAVRVDFTGGLRFVVAAFRGGAHDI